MDSRLESRQSLSRENPSRRPGAHDWERGSQSCAACYLNVFLLIIKQYHLGADGLNVARSLEISIIWAATMLLTPECLHELVWVRPCRPRSSLTVRVLFERTVVCYWTAWLGYWRTECCEVSRNKQNVGNWYIAVDAGNFTWVCVSASLSFNQRTFAVSVYFISALLLFDFPRTSASSVIPHGKDCFIFLGFASSTYKVFIGCFYY